MTESATTSANQQKENDIEMYPCLKTLESMANGTSVTMIIPVSPHLQNGEKYNPLPEIVSEFWAGSNHEQSDIL